MPLPLAIVCIATLALFALFFFADMFISLTYGGSVDLGASDLGAGRFLLSDHGNYFPVTESVWRADLVFHIGWWAAALAVVIEAIIIAVLAGKEGKNRKRQNQ